MQKVGSLLVITLLLVAFGRCVADQYGMLHTTDASCCQTICTTDTHHADDEADNDCNDSSEHQQEEHNNEDTPAPCQLCSILKNDSMQIEPATKVPYPIISDFYPVFDFGLSMDSLLSRISCQVSSCDLITELPDPPAELDSLFRCLVAKTAPVRGPSIA